MARKERKAKHVSKGTRPREGSVSQKELTRQDKMEERANDLIGRWVEYRCKEGKSQGVVRGVMSRADVEREYGPMSRSGRYAVIEGHPFPVRLSRVKVMS